MSLTRKRKLSNIEHSSEQESTDFDSLFYQNWDRICEILYRLLGEWDEAQDIALETFMQLYQHPPKSKDNLNGWLYRVATNLGFNALRARKRRKFYENRAGLIILENNSPGQPEMNLEQLQKQERVRHTLTKIKSRSAKLLILRHSGLTYAEIATALKLSPGSVGTLLTRAEREFEKQYK